MSTLARTPARRVGSRALLGAALLATALLPLAGCFGLAVTGAAIGTMAVMDRRTLGAQTDDRSIELRGLRALQPLEDEQGQVSLSSFNRRALLTGQVRDEAARREAEQRVRENVPNVRDLYNELQIGNNDGSLIGDTRDLGLSVRVTGALVRDRGVPASSIKVITDAGQVYLMGLVTEEEGAKAALIVSRLAGVSRVVTLFEYVSAEDLRRIAGETVSSNGS